MYLLIPHCQATMPVRLLNLHSTMYLLIPYKTAQLSANDYNLHSTMYLLILNGKSNTHKDCLIYIPLCIY